jgi:hypothetical protein
MRRLALALIPSLLLACNEEPTTGPQSAVRLDVSFNFRAGCIAVLARDQAATEKFQVARVPVFDRAESERKVTVAVFRGEGWSDTVQLIATAHERHPNDRDTAPGNGCQGKEVAREEVNGVSLARAEVVRREVSLTATDGDNDGFVLDTANGTDCDDASAARFPGNEEVCDALDNDCDLEEDEGFNKEWYRDGDNDGAVAQSSRVFQCDSPGQGYVQRTTQPFDCDDGDSERAPGRPELCDGKDNNCVGGTDEAFPNRGTPCTNDVCSGVRVCGTDKMSTVCNAPAPVTFYPDADGDTEGAQGSGGTKFCAPATGPAGTVANATDCDDADRSTRAGLAETCDAVDNNCNGQVDEGISCSGTLARVVDGNLGGMGHDWRAVAVHPDGVPVWIAGLNGKLVVRKTAGGPFQGFSYATGLPGDVAADPNNCGNYDWYAAWVRPSDGHVFLAGEGGQVAQHTGSACINQQDLTGSGHATGIIGFESGSGTTLYVVTDGGRLFTWVPGSAAVERDDEGHIYSGIHALDANLLLVGGSTSGGDQRVFAYSNGNLSAEAAHTMSSTNVSGTVNSVWMGTSSLAYAVGNGGAVWRWNGTSGWTRVAAPTGVTANLFGVVTLPNGDAYLVDSSSNGRLHRRTPYGWATRGPTLPTTNKPLFGIAMRSASDFWVVGDDGFVFHYPEPPRP